jgi:hypothetical protein
MELKKTANGIEQRRKELAQGMLDLIDSCALSVHNTHGIRTRVGDIRSSDSILDLTLSTAAASRFVSAWAVFPVFPSSHKGVGFRISAHEQRRTE